MLKRIPSPKKKKSNETYLLVFISGDARPEPRLVQTPFIHVSFPKRHKNKTYIRNQPRWNGALRERNTFFSVQHTQKIKK